MSEWERKKILLFTSSFFFKCTSWCDVFQKLFWYSNRGAVLQKYSLKKWSLALLHLYIAIQHLKLSLNKYFLYLQMYPWINWWLPKSKQFMNFQVVLSHPWEGLSIRALGEKWMDCLIRRFWSNFKNACDVRKHYHFTKYLKYALFASSFIAFGRSPSKIWNLWWKTTYPSNKCVLKHNFA